MKRIAFLMQCCLGLIDRFILITSCSKKDKDAAEQPVPKSTEPEFKWEWTDGFSGTKLDMASWEYSLNNRGWRSAYNDATPVFIKKTRVI